MSLSFFCLFFVCSFIPSFCFFFFYPLFFFLHSVPPSLYLICFFCAFASSFLFCFFFVCWLIGTILYHVSFFSVHSHLLPIFCHASLPTFAHSFYSVSFLRLFAPSFYSVLFFIRLHLLSFMLLSFVVYHIYSVLFISFIHSHLLSVLNISLIPSYFPCFALLIPPDIVFVLFISLLSLHLLSVRLSVFLFLKIPLLNKGNFAKLHLYNNSAETTSVIIAKTIILYQPRLLLYPPRRTKTLSLPLER